MWFFQKKIAIEPLLVDMVDIHSHLLYGVDDGAQHEEETVDIIKGYKSLGINRCYATPHILPNKFNNNEKTLSTVFEERLLPIAKKMDFSINLAAEYMICPTFIQRLRDGDKFLTIKDNYLLLELEQNSSFSDRTLAIFNEISKSGYIPILAHPERYHFLNKEWFLALKNQNVHMQLNVLALAGIYGLEAKKSAEYYLEAGIYDYVGIDCHSSRDFKRVKDINTSKKGALCLSRLINNNTSKF